MTGIASVIRVKEPSVAPNSCVVIVASALSPL